jgi:hypothetical protein
MTSWHSITTAIGLALSGEKVRARRDLITCWEETNEQDHAQRCVIAHYLADLEPDLGDEVAWDERALDANPGVTDDDLTPIGIPHARGLAPSLHLNLGDGYLRQCRIDDAASQLAAGLAAEDALGNDGYGALIRKGLSSLADRIAQAQHSTSSRTEPREESADADADVHAP